MPTYKFYCKACDNTWTARQGLSVDKSIHTAKCPECAKECENIALGGTGFQSVGRHMNKQLEGFPDYTNKVNQGAERDAAQMEKIHDAKNREDSKKIEKE